MFDLKVYPTFTAVGIKDRVVFLPNSGTGNLLHEILISPSVPSELEKNKETENGKAPHQPANVVTMEYSVASKVFTVSLSDKSVQNYQLTETADGQLSSEPLGERIHVARTIVCMKFAPKHGVLFGCDKGDCFEFDPFAKADNRSKWILGHMSQILDLVVSEDERFIVTCDRDEKIKVTSYPDCHNVVCYCLGHHEYVAGLGLLAAPILLSVSGDKTLRLWDYGEGKQVASHDLEDAAVGVTLHPLTDGKGTLCAVRSYVENKIEVVQINVVDDQQQKCTTCETLSVDVGLTILSATLNASCELIILAIDKESKAVRFMVYTFNGSERRFEQCSDSGLQKNLQDLFRESRIEHTRDYSTLFKNTIDNMSDYFERKKMKMGGKKPS